MDRYTFLPLARIIGWRGRVDYHHYLSSQTWQRKAAAVRRKQNYRCERCGRRARLDVHHKTYERLGMERQSDLVGLCRACHDNEHNRTTAGRERHGLGLVVEFVKRLFA